MEEGAFKLIEQTYRSSGPEAVFDLLIRGAREEKNYPALFGARLMQARHQLGLPLIETEPVPSLSDEQRPVYEKAFKEAARETGGLFLASGDIAGAWPYFKAIGERAPVAAAIEKVNGGENLDRVIEIAFQEGVNRRKGFELILEHHGICSAITWFGSNRDYDSRQECLRLLVRTLHGQVAAALKETVAAAEGAAPDTNSVAGLIAGRAWLFEGMSNYIDSTHLTAVLRFTPELEDIETLRMARELADYGRCLDAMFHFRGDPPFEDTYFDHAMYLRALTGEDVDVAIAHFRKKITGPASAEVLIELLVRLGLYVEAIRASLECFADPNSTVLQMCQIAGDYEQLRSVARRQGDLLGFAAGIIQG